MESRSVRRTDWQAARPEFGARKIDHDDFRVSDIEQDKTVHTMVNDVRRRKVPSCERFLGLPGKADHGFLLALRGSLRSVVNHFEAGSCTVYN
jgi:hypothetical protein